MDWQNVIRTATDEASKEAASAKWRDYALARLPEINGWKLDKPKAFGAGSKATYTGQTKGGLPLRVTVDKGKGVWVAEAGGLQVEDDIAGLDARSVKFALDEAADAMDQHVQERRKKPFVAARDFASVDARRLSGNLHDIRQRSDDILEKLGDMVLEENGRLAGLTDIRETELDNGTTIGYNLDMIEQGTGAFKGF